jgi:hypothetical protein
MGSNELHEHAAEPVRHVDDQSVLVAAEIEDHAVVANEIDGSTELPFDLVWALPARLLATANQTRICTLSPVVKMISVKPFGAVRMYAACSMFTSILPGPPISHFHRAIFSTPAVAVAPRQFSPNGLLGLSDRARPTARDRVARAYRWSAPQPPPRPEGPVNPCKWGVGDTRICKTRAKPGKPAEITAAEQGRNRAPELEIGAAKQVPPQQARPNLAPAIIRHTRCAGASSG